MSHLQQGTMNSLINCVYEYTVVEWPNTPFWWITRASSLRFSCSGCAWTGRFNRLTIDQHDLNPDFLQAIWDFARCLLQSLLVTSSRVTLCVIPCQHHTQIVTDMKNRPIDVISIHHRIYVSLKGYTWSFRVQKTLTRVLLCFYSP
mgnify:CR=1 FL=1